jgi:hypothetical protein
MMQRQTLTIILWVTTFFSWNIRHPSQSNGIHVL